MRGGRAGPESCSGVIKGPGIQVVGLECRGSWRNTFQGGAQRLECSYKVA